MAQELDPIMKNMLKTVSTAITLAALCAEFALDMAEAGHAEKVRPMITKLDSLAKTTETGDQERLRADMVSFMAEVETLRMFCQKKARNALGIGQDGNG